MTITDSFLQRITAKFDSPLFGGGGVSSEVPGKFPFALAGHNYFLDTAVDHTFTDYWQHESIPLVRAQADTSGQPAEATLNPEGLWRRAQDSWHHGAGQVYRDRDTDADIYRYHASKGLDPWTKYLLSMLPDTTQSLSSANTNLLLAAAGARLYTLDGTAVKYTTDLSSWSTVTSTGSNAKASLCSDGYTVYFTDGSDVYSTNTGATSASVYNTLDCTLVAYVKGRLMAANAGAIYNITSGSAPSALFTQGSINNTQFTWVGFAEGRSAIYAAGYSGDKSLIYQITVKPDASALDQPVVAGELPDGEIIRSVQGYLGFIVLGTDTGFRFCDVDASGNLIIGTRVATTSAVKCFEPQDRFVWYGLTNYDSTSTGLGRMDITQFTDTPNTTSLVPAYSSDLMVTGTGAVLSVASFLSKRVFTVSGLGVYYEASTKVASGTMTTGLISYGIPDPKVAMYCDVRTQPLLGSWAVALSTDDSAFVGQGTTMSTATTTGGEINLNQSRADHFELQFTITRSGTDTTSGPVFERWTMKAFPTTNDQTAESLRIPILLRRIVFDVPFDVGAERDFIKSLRANRTVTTCQELESTYTGFVEDYHWVPQALEVGPNGQWTVDGTMVVNFKRVS